MNNYETVIILKGDATEEERQKVLNDVKKFITEKGKIIKTEEIGLKNLAYEVRKYKQGYYYIINFECSSDVIYELERIYRITETIIKFITIRI